MHSSKLSMINVDVDHFARDGSPKSAWGRPTFSISHLSALGLHLHSQPQEVPSPVKSICDKLMPMLGRKCDACVWLDNRGSVDLRRLIESSESCDGIGTVHSGSSEGRDSLNYDYIFVALNIDFLSDSTSKVVQIEFLIPWFTEGRSILCYFL